MCPFCRDTFRFQRLLWLSRRLASRCIEINGFAGLANDLRIKSPFQYLYVNTTVGRNLSCEVLHTAEAVLSSQDAVDWSFN